VVVVVVVVVIMVALLVEVVVGVGGGARKTFKSSSIRACRVAQNGVIALATHLRS